MGKFYRIQNELSKIIDKKAVYVNTSSSLASYINDSNATRVPTKNKWFNIPDDKKILENSVIIIVQNLHGGLTLVICMNRCKISYIEMKK